MTFVRPQHRQSIRSSRSEQANFEFEEVDNRPQQRIDGGRRDVTFSE